MSLDYNLLETFKLFLDSLNFNIMISIIISSLILTIILILNKDKKYINYIVLGVNVILIITICVLYMKEILTFKFSNPLNNIYFYFFNTIICLILMSIINFKTKYKKTNFIIYGLSLINILFSIFMTIYLNNVHLIVMGNIFPMIKFGNIIYLIYYILIIINVVMVLWRKYEYKICRRSR